MDDLSSAMERLRTATQRINSVADSAAKAVKLVEKFLEEAGVGVHAWTLVTHVDDEDDAEGFAVYLEYRRLHSGKFRIAVVQTPDSAVDNEGETVRAWSECSREEKLECFGKLPALLLELAKRVDEQTAEAEKALAVIAAKFPLLQQKNGG